MRGSVPRRGWLALGAVVFAAGSIATATPAAAAPAAACTSPDGITVMVDFGSLGGGVQIRCVDGPVSSGFDALVKAGFTFAGAQRFPGLLCRIDGKPSAATDPCVNAPPSDRYWGYWTASAPGGAWTYSDLGAGNRTPPPGSVEGWAFDTGCDRKPGSPLCPSAGPTTTRPTTTTTARPAPGGTAPTTTLATGGGSSPDDPDSPDAPDDSSTTTADADAVDSTTTTPPGDRAPAAGEEGDDEIAGDAVPAGTSRDAGGSPAGVLVGLGAVLALAGAGTVIVRRRRAEGEGTG